MRGPTFKIYDVSGSTVSGYARSAFIWREFLFLTYQCMVSEGDSAMR